MLLVCSLIVYVRVQKFLFVTGLFGLAMFWLGCDLMYDYNGSCLVLVSYLIALIED